MITLTAKINLISSNSDKLDITSHNLVGNNISGVVGDVLGKNKQSKNPFIFGVSKFGDNSTLQSHLDYFIGNQLPNDNGLFENSYTITIQGEDIDSLTFVFDTANNRHPNYIIVDGKVYDDNDPIFTLSLEKSNTHTINIDNWNYKSPLVIQGIFIDLSVELKYNNLLNLLRTISQRSDIKLPSYGVISNVGDLSFNDFNGEFSDYAEQLLLKNNLSVEILLSNTLSKKYEKIGSFLTNEWNYDNDNRIVSLSLKDNLEEWQEIHFEGISYDPREPFKYFKTIKDLYIILQNEKVTPKKYNMLPFEMLDSQTQEILTKTQLRYPVVDAGTLWSTWQKVCEVCALYIYKNNKGETVCSYTYGS